MSGTTRLNCMGSISQARNWECERLARMFLRSSCGLMDWSGWFGEGCWGWCGGNMKSFLIHNKRYISIKKSKKRKKY